MLPNEIIMKIIQYTSHRYLAQISLVCKDWYFLTRSPFLYKTIKIHNKKQLYDFLNITAKVTLTMNRDNKPVGYYVQQFILEDYFQWDALTVMEVDLIFKTCPNITFIDGMNSPELWAELWENSLHFSKMNYFLQLSDLLLWFTNNTTGWYKMIQHNNKYTSLEFEIIPDMIQSTDDDDRNNNNNNNKGLYIQCQQGHQIRRLKLNEIPTLGDYGQDTIWDNIEIIDGEKYICYYSKVFHLSISFHYLKHLLIDFGRYSYTRGRKLAYTLELDERTIESIHEHCPLLESLDLREFYMNISPSTFNHHHHLMNKSSSSSSSSLTATATIQPCLSLKHLSLTDCFIHHLESFEYFSLKYPNVSTLSLDLAQYFRTTDSKKCEIKMGLYKLLSSYTHLTTFSTHFKYWNDFLPIPSIKNNWIDKELISWFMNHPHLALKLCYYREFDMLTTEEEEEKEEKEDGDDDDDSQETMIKNNKHIYMNNMVKLNLANENNISETFSCLKKLSRLGIHFQHLTTLIIRNTSFFVNDNYFDFYLWLDLLSNLKKLKLENTVSDYNILDKRMTVDLCKQQSQQKKNITYLLEEIEIINTRLRLSKKNGLTNFGHSCPSIHIFKLMNIYIEYEDEDDFKLENNEDEVIIIDTTHLELNQLVIKNIFTPINKHIPENIKRPFELIVTESNNKIINEPPPPFKIKLPSLCRKSELEIWKIDDIHNYDLNQDTISIYSPIKMILNCKYVDVVTCINY